MELNQLKYFYFVTQYGSFTKAAAALHIHQPGVSKAVSLLEKNLGVQLLERHKRKVFLTKVGEEIYKKCERIFQDCEEIKALAEGERTICQGPLIFCASEPVASHLVPEVNESLLKDYPSVIPTSYCGATSHLFEKIISGEFEFGIFLHTPELSPDLEMKKLITLPHELVIASKKFDDKVVRSSFIGSREVDDNRTRRFPTIERIKKYNPEVEIRISSNSLTAHKQMVSKGLGISILPRFLVEKELHSGTFKRLYPKEHFEFPLKLVLRKNKCLSRNARLWLEHLDVLLLSMA